MERETIEITDPADVRIEAFRDIRERDIVGRSGFIAEGTVVLDQLLRSGRFRPTALLVLRNRLANLAPRLVTLPPNVPIYVADRHVFDSVAGFPVHRGVMAHGVAVAPQASEDPLDEILTRTKAVKGVVVVACGIANHDNMGAIFRNAAAFDAGAVLIDGPACDPLYRKAIRVSVGTVLTVPFFRLPSAADIVARLGARGFECLALSPAGSMRLDEVRDTKPRALFLGTEGEGLPDDVMRSGTAVRIAMAPGLDSLNVAASAAIVLHHFFALRHSEGPR